MAKIGDRVRFLNSVGGGRIVRIDGNIAHVEDEDGFDVPVLLKECVVVDTPSPSSVQSPKQKDTPAVPPSSKAVDCTPQSDSEPLPIEETPGGDRLNVVIGFEADDLKRLSATSFEATLVNDSNYYLSFVFATRSSDEQCWTLRHASTVEPNIMLSLGRYDATELNSMERILFQYVAYKADRPFDVKSPASVEQRLDITRFCRLHCFRENPYFDAPVIAVDIVTDDCPAIPLKADPVKIEQAMKQKIVADRPARRPISRKPPHKDAPLEVDLHINQLVDTTAGLSRADMLNRQIDEFRRVMDANLRNYGKKIVFIHGKGEGVLRQALLKELSHRYKGHDVSDASFREYGFGATQVTIKMHPK